MDTGYSCATLYCKRQRLLLHQTCQAVETVVAQCCATAPLLCILATTPLHSKCSIRVADVDLDQPVEPRRDKRSGIDAAMDDCEGNVY
jgi:hypothetical protein